MFRRTILKTTLAVAFAASALLATAASSQDVIKLGSIAPKLDRWLVARWLLNGLMWSSG